MTCLTFDMQVLRNYQHAPGWCVAFSGGLDSTVLLHVLSRFVRAHKCPPLRAIHVHHGLQSIADNWPEHCQKVCAGFDVLLQVVYIQVPEQASVEQAARDARYAVFAQNLLPGEVLLMAQHQDDQAETLLLRLLRGAGVAGLQGMPQARVLAHAQLLRPLLHISRKQLEAYAADHGLRWIEDPSNQSDDYDRNFLRNRVTPLLSQRWPAFSRVFQRTGQHMQEAQQLLNELATQDLALAQMPKEDDWLPLPALRLDVVKSLSFIRQKNLLRYWLTDREQAVDAAHWAGWNDLLGAAPDAEPMWRLKNGALQRYRQLIYWLPEQWLAAPQMLSLKITEIGEYELPGNGLLCVQGQLAGPLTVSYRQGGECMRLPKRGRRDLKRLLQEQGVAPFVRQRLPLLFDEQNELVAVAGLPDLRAQEWPCLQLEWLLAEGTVHKCLLG